MAIPLELEDSSPPALRHKYLLQRSWWRRMWVAQEVVLGEGHKEDAVVVCGGRRISFMAFVNGVQSLMENALRYSTTYSSAGMGDLKALQR